MNQHLVAKRSYVAEALQTQIIESKKSSTDEKDFLELWADDDFDNNTLFTDNRLPHEKPPIRSPSKRLLSKKPILPWIRRVKVPVKIESDTLPSKSIELRRENPPNKIIIEKPPVNTITKKGGLPTANAKPSNKTSVFNGITPLIKSVVRKVAVSSQPTKICESQFVRKSTNRGQHSSIVASTPQNGKFIPFSSHKHPQKRVAPTNHCNDFIKSSTYHCQILSNNKLTKVQESQTNFGCNDCDELLIRLADAQNTIRQLTAELVEKGEPCTKCSNRTKRTNIRQRNKTKIYREFFRLHNSENTHE